jgi:acyl-CoA reductase-like NAD-dependent aldehyde dehydrogenase
MIIKKPIQHAIIIDKQGDRGVFDTMNDAINLAYEACEEYSNYSLSRRNEIIDAVIKELEYHIEELSLMTFKEFGDSSYDDLLCRNLNALSSCEINKYLESKFAPTNKLSNYENSLTVNGVVVPPTNPIETIIRNSILILRAGDSVVFSSNRDFKNVFAYTIKLINNAIIAVNGPKNLIVTVKEPSIENTNMMIEHEKITLVSAIDNSKEKIAL